jgi:hypothetical protein
MNKKVKLKLKKLKPNIIPNINLIKLNYLNIIKDTIYHQPIHNSHSMISNQINIIEIIAKMEGNLNMKNCISNYLSSKIEDIVRIKPKGKTLKAVVPLLKKNPYNNTPIS